MKNFFFVLMIFISSITNAQSVNTLDPNQVYTTNNIVLPTNQGGPSSWTNGIYQDNLTCWAFGLFGYCGPNPIVRPGNDINFSYGQTDLYQTRSVASLFSNPTKLQINGYNFGFTAKNGNGWDDGRVDQLNAYVNLYDRNGGVLVSKNYDLNYKFNWTTFNYNETFTKPYAVNDVGNIRYGFVGKDNNFWAGPYGPEINNISFSLKYSVDPCSINVLSSPSCPGYINAINSLTPAPLVTSTEVVTSSTISTTLQPPTTISQTPVTSVVNAALPTSSSPASAPVLVSTSSNNNKETTVNSNSVLIGLSVVAKNAQREQSIAMQAAQNAVAAAEQTAQLAQQEAVNVAQASASQSIAMAMPTTTKSDSATQKTDQSNVLPMTNSSNQFVQNIQPIVQPNTKTNEKNNLNNFSVNAAQESFQSQNLPISTMIREQSAILQPQVTTPVVPQRQTTITQTQPQTSSLPTVVQEQTTITQTQTSFALLPPQQSQQIITQTIPVFVSDAAQTPQSFLSVSQQSIFTTNDLTIFESQKLLTDRTNPINDIIEGRNIELPTTSTIQQKTTVNTNVSDNEISGSVNINKMATSPVGYNQYLSFVIADASFYAPKEIYKGQKNVDNVRALRRMSSDRLHQEMIDQQYRK